MGLDLNKMIIIITSSIEDEWVCGEYVRWGLSVVGIESVSPKHEESIDSYTCYPVNRI